MSKTSTHLSTNQQSRTVYYYRLDSIKTYFNKSVKHKYQNKSGHKQMEGKQTGITSPADSHGKP